MKRLSTLLLTTLALLFTLSCQQKTSDTASEEETVVEEPTGFNKAMTFGDGYAFNVTATDTGSINTLTIEPSGQELNNDAVTHNIEGRVVGAEVADLNGDKYPEVLVFITGPGSGSYGSLIAYSSNKGKSMSQVSFPDIMNEPGASKGYQGHDVFSIENGKLTRRFQTYKGGEANARPTGPIRQIEYILKDGEASRQFWVDNVIQYNAR